MQLLGIGWVLTLLMIIAAIWTSPGPTWQKWATMAFVFGCYSLAWAVHVNLK